MAKEYLVLTAVGRDKVGTVEMLTDVVVNHSANIEESRMARLGGEFAVIMLLSLAAEKVEPLVNALPSLQKKGLTVTSRRTDLTRVSEFKGYVPHAGFNQNSWIFFYYIAGHFISYKYYSN